MLSRAFGRPARRPRSPPSQCAPASVGSSVQPLQVGIGDRRLGQLDQDVALEHACLSGRSTVGHVEHPDASPEAGKALGRLERNLIPRQMRRRSQDR